MLLKYRILKVKHNQQTPKDAKLHVLPNGFLGFSKFWVFDPEKQFFYRYKNGIYILELCATSMCTKFQANIFIFGCAMAQKPSDGNDVTFLKFDIWNFSLS